MRLYARPINKLTYKLKLNPQIKLNITLLQMPLAQLNEFIKQQVEENPLLNIENDEPLSNPNKTSEEDIKTYSEFEADPIAPGEFSTSQEKYRENTISTPYTLAEHLLRQLHLLSNYDYERSIGKHIIGNIDENGYLRYSIKDIAQSIATHPSRVEKVLLLIQTFDPIGVGARNLRECLLLQLKAKEDECSLTVRIVDKYLPYLEKKRYNIIAGKLKVSREKIKEAVKEMARLNPKPGRSFNAERTLPLIPEAILRKNKNDYEVILNDWELPRITLNDKYKKMLKQKDIPSDTKEYLRERLRASRILINGIHKRKETIQKIIEEIVYIQKEFFDKGILNFKPLTLEQIAKRIEKHKSTVSRAIANKYLLTPWGTHELKYFLNPGIKQKNGEFFSSRAIKSNIREIIAHENKNHPLPDREIADHLKQDGISVARRTITKYREQLKILPSLSRRE